MIKYLVLLAVVGLAYGRPQMECPAEGHLLLSHESDCSKYYICASGRKSAIALSCPPDNLFSFNKQNCVQPCDSDCFNKDGTIIAGFSLPESHSRCVCPPAPETSSQAPPVTTEPPEVIWLENGCPSDSTHVDKLLPHPDCTKFYQCVHGEKVEMPCAPGGTHFSYELQRCDWPEVANCTPGEITERPPGVTNPPAETPPSNPIPEGDDIVWLPNGCPEDYRIEKLLPHPDCEKYYQCVHGNKVAMPCAPGTHFSYELQRCEMPHIANCIPGEVDPEPEPPCCCPPCVEPELPCNGTEPEQPCPNPPCNGTEPEQPCPNPPCNGTEPEQPCPNPPCNGTEPEQPCPNPPCNGTEPEQPCPNPPCNGTEPEPQPPCNGTDCEDDIIWLPNGCPANFSIEKLLPHEECDRYYRCVKGIIIEIPCECGLHFSYELQRCDLPEIAQCIREDPKDKKCRENCEVPFWRDETDCDKFWRCEGEKAVQGVCSEGLFFNEEKQSCDFICNVPCVRKVTQSTARKDGLSLFLPWAKIDRLFNLSRQDMSPK